jgi:N-methylhydantoinase A/oxoprolinase/acetone carboxylase beta subunit
MLRIGIDVGGTNTDAVLLDNQRVRGAIKSPTTEDVISGVANALKALIKECPDAAIAASVTIGTTHFLNAVVERQRLNKVAALRICLPAAASLPPFVDWPDDIANVIRDSVCLVQGGHEYDGRPIAELDVDSIAAFAHRCAERGVTSIAISSVFSPLDNRLETRAQEIISEIDPKVRVTCSHMLGRIGLLERENATILNAALLDIAVEATQSFEAALKDVGLAAALYISLNDGTVADVALARKFPVFCFASGATNSMRGAAFLSALDNALVCDVGGTTSDIGCLVNGFPREANNVVEIGGVRTSFRMPDLTAIGVGGGTRVRQDPLKVGPDSVGYRLPQEAMVFGGKTLTLTDVAVRQGVMNIGDVSAIDDFCEEKAADIMAIVSSKIADTVDRMKTEAVDSPLIAVGGGSALIPASLPGVSEVLHVPHAGVANAIGAALAQVSGETDQVYQGLSRDEVLELATHQAKEKAVAAGADPKSLKVVEVEDIPIAYLPGHAIRARVRVTGDIADHVRS